MNKSVDIAVESEQFQRMTDTQQSKINEYIQQWLCRFRLGGETDETSNGHISSSSDASNAQRNIDCYFHFLFDILISIFDDS